MLKTDVMYNRDNKTNEQQYSTLFNQKSRSFTLNKNSHSTIYALVVLSYENWKITPPKKKAKQKNNDYIITPTNFNHAYTVLR